MLIRCYWLALIETFKFTISVFHKIVINYHHGLLCGGAHNGWGMNEYVYYMCVTHHIHCTSSLCLYVFLVKRAECENKCPSWDNEAHPSSHLNLKTSRTCKMKINSAFLHRKKKLRVSGRNGRQQHLGKFNLLVLKNLKTLKNLTHNNI